MLVMVFSVIVAGFLLVPRTEEAKLKWLAILGTTNHGELFNPPLEGTPALTDAAGDVWPQTDEPVWRMLLVTRSGCDQACLEMADLASRVHIRLNKLAPMVRRGHFALSADENFSTPAGFDRLDTDREAWMTHFDTAGISALLQAGPVLMLQDPRELFFMYYSPSHDGIGMLEDLEHVIKLSR